MKKILQAGLGSVLGALVIATPAPARVQARDLNVKLDCGARGDGAADDTDRIQACIDRAAASGQAVYLPTGAYRITMAGGLDHVTLPQLFAPAAGEEGWSRVGGMWATAGQPHKYYLAYFGENQPWEFAAAVPPDEKYDAVLIDTWEMTETPLAASVVAPPNRL